MKAHIAEYTIINGTSDKDLIKAVNSDIQQGWRPIGGPIAVNNLQGHSMLLQAMVRSDAQG